ncbi:hypothetical protein [Chenggangzhangella methanolivorans]|uniref:Uncharacterized protein n=1 Tax=Chenggangzhangella methanolivorans TaxID=1437009 RepID=A0A9E6RAG0_9HYPH|nr:hypothetical protein [Chenggangzhangella methanolivorans]QZN99768.1 hypothetical protein K6K41_24390 [Chenggangzhangella methanolivorans]
MDVRQTLNWILKETGWKQDRLAVELEATQATVSRWLAGSDPSARSGTGSAR